MRLSAFLLVLALLGIVAGGVLIGRWAVGVAVIFDSLCIGWWALQRDDEGRDEVPARLKPGGLTLAEVLERARRSS